MKRVSVRDSYMSILKDYSNKTGISVTQCVSDALSDWLANVAPLALDPATQESIRGPTRYLNVIVMIHRSRYLSRVSSETVDSLPFLSRGCLKTVRDSL
jgi:hypothetical protein